MTSAHLLKALGAALAFGLFAAAHAADDPNATCMMCHADAAAKGASGKSIAVDAERFAKSVHGEMQFKCTDCHADVSADKLPHPEKLKPPACANCHEQAVKDYTGTAHGKARKDGRMAAASCTDCHGSHDIKRSKDPESRTNHVNLEKTCASCHGNEALIQKAHLPGGNIAGLYHDSIHGKLVGTKGPRQAMAPECTDCHGTHNIRSKSEADSRVARANVPTTCGSCHQREKIVFDKGQHGKMQQAGNVAAPVCIDCHSAHTIQETTRPEWQLAVIGQCGNCHDDFVSSYRLTYHGKVTDLGFANMATCASCHGAHDVRPASDPLSNVSPENRLQTCRNCHKDASAKFASWDPHPQPGNKERSVVLYYTSIFMNVLLAGVFVFFGLHTVLWAYQSIGAALKRRRGSR
jgi:nitrate/TMAO reductase-like tetraheme cytochrome c subunit